MNPWVWIFPHDNIKTHMWVYRKIWRHLLSIPHFYIQLFQISLLIFSLAKLMRLVFTMEKMVCLWTEWNRFIIKWPSYRFLGPKLNFLFHLKLHTFDFVLNFHFYIMRFEMSQIRRFWQNGGRLGGKLGREQNPDTIKLNLSKFRFVPQTGQNPIFRTFLLLRQKWSFSNGF